jgi:hypothetical protein
LDPTDLLLRLIRHGKQAERLCIHQRRPKMFIKKACGIVSSGHGAFA